MHQNADGFAIAGSQTGTHLDGRRALWSGDANLTCNDTTQPGNVRHKIKYQGACTDVGSVTSTIQFYNAPPTHGLVYD